MNDKIKIFDKPRKAGIMMAFLSRCYLFFTSFRSGIDSFSITNLSIPFRVPCVCGLSGKRTFLSKIAGTPWIHVSGVQDERGGEAPCTTDPGNNFDQESSYVEQGRCQCESPCFDGPDSPPSERRQMRNPLGIKSVATDSVSLDPSREDRGGPFGGTKCVECINR